MSNGIRYDSFMVRHLAAELHERLAGRPVRRVGLDPGSEARRVVVHFDDDALTWDLHPARGQVVLGAPAVAHDQVPVHHRASVGGVRAPVDERVLFLDIDSPGGSTRQARQIVFELMTNQWNALVLSRKREILAVMRSRHAGGRVLRAGKIYAPPPATDRLRQPDRESWRELLAGIPPAERPSRLVSRVAYVSTTNARAILGAAAEEGNGAGDVSAAVDAGTAADASTAAKGGPPADTSALDDAWARYNDLVARSEPRPCVIIVRGSPQPYPFPLPGLEIREELPTLLDAIAAAAVAGGMETPRTAGPHPSVPPALLERLRKRHGRAESKRKHLALELDGAAPQAAALRNRANLLLSQLTEVRRGMKEVRLPDLEGGTVTIQLDPALDPVENANRLYEDAKKRERAAERLPALIREADAQIEELSGLLERAESGEADAAAVEERIGGADRRTAGETDPEKLPPYRRYRTSGGLEVRVGRNRRANDELTFHHSSPEDIWLHSREVAGSHVVLRWGDKNGNPPKSDLLEAAVLAALNSKARTSGTVAVDWTRRKYVRKPRKAPAGAVLPDRVQTIFVEPDPRLEERLREGD